MNLRLVSRPALERLAQAVIRLGDMGDVGAYTEYHDARDAVIEQAKEGLLQMQARQYFEREELMEREKGKVKKCQAKDC